MKKNSIIKLSVLLVLLAVIVFAQMQYSLLSTIATKFIDSYIGVYLYKLFLITKDDYLFSVVFMGIVISVLAFIIVALKKYIFPSQKTLNKSVLLLTIVAIVSFFLTGYALKNLDDYFFEFTNLASSDKTNSLVGETIDNYDEMDLFYLEYVDGRTIYVHPDIYDKAEDTMLKMYYTKYGTGNYKNTDKINIQPKNELKYYNEAHSLPKDTTTFVRVDSQYSFVMDGYDSGDVYMLPSNTYDNSFVIISETSYKDISLTNNKDTNYTTLEFEEVEDTDENSETELLLNPLFNNSEIKYVAQILVMLGVLISGAMLLFLIKGDGLGIYELIISFPIGLALNTLLYLLYFIVNIPITTGTYTVFFVILILACLYLCVKKGKKRIIKTSYKNLIYYTLGFIIIAFFLLYFDRLFLGPDSQRAIKMAYLLNTNGGYLTGDHIATFNAYGFLSPSTASLGFSLGSGLLYVAYPMMYISMLLFLAYEVYTYAKQHIPQYALIAGMLAGISVMFIHEFEAHYFWFQGNMPVGIFMLILINSLLHLSDDNKIEHIVIACIISALIVISRTEGAVFVAVFTGSALLLCENKKALKQVMIVNIVFVLLYNLWMMIISGGFSTPFWSIDKAAMSILASVAVLIAHFIIQTDFLKLKSSKYRLFNLLLCFLFLVFIGVALVAPIDTVKHNIFILGGQMMWASLFPFTMLLVIVLFTLPFDIHANNSKEDKFTFFIVLAYIIIMMAIFFLRTSGGESLPTRIGVGDSGRRVLMQMIPFTMLLLNRTIVRRIKNKDIKYLEDLND